MDERQKREYQTVVLLAKSDDAKYSLLEKIV
jgi:hypothetical protein